MGDRERHSEWLRYVDRVGRGSNCVRRKVGAILVSDGTVLASGCNGVPSEFRDCLAAGCPRCAAGGAVGQGYDECICVHAEQRAIGAAASDGVRLRGSILYVNLRPCLGCVILALESGVRGVVFKGNWSYQPNLEILYQQLVSGFSFFIWSE